MSASIPAAWQQPCISRISQTIAVYSCFQLILWDGALQWDVWTVILKLWATLVLGWGVLWGFLLVKKKTPTFAKTGPLWSHRSTAWGSEEGKTKFKGPLCFNAKVTFCRGRSGGSWYLVNILQITFIRSGSLENAAGDETAVAGVRQMRKLGSTWKKHCLSELAK